MDCDIASLTVRAQGNDGYAREARALLRIESLDARIVISEESVIYTHTRGGRYADSVEVLVADALKNGSPVQAQALLDFECNRRAVEKEARWANTDSGTTVVVGQDMRSRREPMKIGDQWF